MRYKICKTFEEVKVVVEYVKITKICVLDFETRADGPRGLSVSKDDDKPTGPQFDEDEPTILGICFQAGGGYSIPLFHKEAPYDRRTALKILKYIGKHIMENVNITKIAWNTKFELKWFIRYGFTLRGLVHDGMLMKYVLDENPPNGLKDMVAKFFPKYAHYEDEVHKLKVQHGGWANIPLKPLSRYCVMDCHLTYLLVLHLEQKVIKAGFMPLYRNMCMMQTRVLAESEMMGLLVDKPYLEETMKQQKRKIEITLNKVMTHKKVKRFQQWRVKDQIKKLIQTTKDEINKLIKDSSGKDVSRQIANRQEKISRYIAGELVTKKERVKEFNLASPKQVVAFLYTSEEGLRLPIVKFTKDKNKQPTTTPSTDEETLNQLKRKDKSGFIENLLSYREMSKLYSTYMVGVHDKLTSRSTVHGQFWIHGTVTGRMSSRDPNLQNIPRAITSNLIKPMFIPPPGHLLMEVDYGQAELRVAAELSKDEAMIEIFRKNYNVHVATGCKLAKAFDRYEEVKKIIADDSHPEHVFWEKKKKAGKVLNFSILYLQSDKMTADQMTDVMGEEISVEEAADFKADWFREFKGIKKWMAQQERFVKEHGYVMNMFGRKRRLPDIWDMNRGTQNKAIRDCINAPIQGASSDFTQFATAIIRERRLRGELMWTDEPKYQYQVYTVHDSIGFYAKPQYIHQSMKTISEICSDPDTLKYFGFEMKEVKMKVSGEIGINWGSLRDYSANEDYSKLLLESK